MDGKPTERRGGAPSGLRRLVGEEPSKAITSFARNEFVHPTADRFLTLRECARIQTFPDAFAFAGSASEQALLIGNAVPVAFATHIARHLAAELRNDLTTTAAAGRLLTFVPTMSSGRSPALQRVTDAVRGMYGVADTGAGPSANHERQLELWR